MGSAITHWIRSPRATIEVRAGLPELAALNQPWLGAPRLKPGRLVATTFPRRSRICTVTKSRAAAWTPVETAWRPAGSSSRPDASVATTHLLARSETQSSRCRVTARATLPPRS